MKTTTIETVTKMMESLPEHAQKLVAEQVRNFIADIEDESKWDRLFEEKKDKLSQVAQKAKQEIANGKSELMDYNKL
jgi:hypothetical protein